MANFKLSEAAEKILSGRLDEDSKTSFEANVKSKQGQREDDGTQGKRMGSVGKDKLPTSTVAGQQDVGDIGHSPEKDTDELPDYLKGTPSATPPGATPPVGSEKDGVGATKPKNQPQDSEGRKDVMHGDEEDAEGIESIANRVASKLAKQTMQPNKGATFQSYGEDIDAIMSGENLSEEFKERAATIYEAAVATRAVAIAEEVVTEIENELVEQFEDALEEIKEDLATKVDGYLNYMVEEWMKENEIAIEKGLRAEIVEDFIDGLRELFVEHYIDIPEDKVNVVEELTARVEQLEGALNEQIETAVEMKKEINEHKKVEAIYAACESLTQTQVEKMKSLAESIEFTTEEEFGQKLETLKESYFSSSVKVADNSALDDEVLLEEDNTKSKGSVDPLMEQYAKTISQTLKI